MQRLFIILSALLLISMAASADARGKGGQGGKGYGGNGGVNRQAQFQQELNLSDEQISQMQAIRLNGGTREEMHSVLNDEQRAMVEARRSEMKGRGGRGGNGRGRGNGQGFGNAQADTQDLQIPAGGGAGG